SNQTTGPVDAGVQITAVVVVGEEGGQLGQQAHGREPTARRRPPRESAAPHTTRFGLRGSHNSTEPSAAIVAAPALISGEDRSLTLSVVPPLLGSEHPACRSPPPPASPFADHPIGQTGGPSSRHPTRRGSQVHSGPPHSATTGHLWTHSPCASLHGHRRRPSTFRNPGPCVGSACRALSTSLADSRGARLFGVAAQREIKRKG